MLYRRNQLCCLFYAKKKVFCVLRKKRQFSNMGIPCDEKWIEDLKFMHWMLWIWIGNKSIFILLEKFLDWVVWWASNFWCDIIQNNPLLNRKSPLATPLRPAASNSLKKNNSNFFNSLATILFVILFHK